MKIASPILLSLLIMITSCSSDKYRGEVSFLEHTNSKESRFISIIEKNRFYSQVEIVSIPVDSNSSSFRISMRSPDSLPIAEALNSLSRDLNSEYDKLSQLKQIGFETELSEAEKMDTLLQDSLQIVARELDLYLNANGSYVSDSLQTIRKKYNEVIQLIDSTKRVIEQKKILSRSYASSSSLLSTLNRIDIFPINRGDTVYHQVVVPGNR